MRLKLDHPEDEIERWDAMRHGDTLSFKWLYERYFDPLYNYGRKIGVDEQLLHDSIHDVFVDLWFYHDNLSSVKSVKLYLYRSWRRKVSRHIDGQSLINALDSLLDPGYRMEDTAIEPERIGMEAPDLLAYHLRKLVNDLSPRQYEALMLRCYEEFTCAEIADILDINEQSAYTLVQRGLTQLRQFAKLVISAGLLLWIGF